MGIKLDWEVESEGGWDEVGEDPKAIEARRRQARRARNGLLAALAIIAVMASIIAYRLFRVGRQVREALEATVAAETLALRIGDREAYLEAQSTLGGWRQIQERAFRQYQAEGARVEVTGQIAQMDISADQARVTLREVVDGNAYHVMWFYQRDAGGWKHIASAPRFWGDQQEHRSTYFNFDYYSEDQALVDELIGPLDEWWRTACDLTQCSDKPASLDVKIEVDPLAEVGWAQYDTNTLIIPSPLLGRFPADGKPDPALMSRLADLIANRWAEYLVGEGDRPYSETDWLRSEVHQWLWQSFDPAQPPAPMLTPLVQAYGEQIVPLLIERVKRGDPAVLVLQELTGANTADLPVGWELYFTYMLRAEVSLLQEGKETEAILLYRDPATTNAAVTFPLAQSKIDTIQVVGLHRYGNLVWAETMFSGVPLDAVGRTLEGTMTIFLPFRLLADRWVRTVAAEPDWGPVVEDRGAHVILRYHDLDAPAVAGLQTALEQAYNQVDTDVGGLGNVPLLVEIVGCDFQGHALPFQEPDLGEEMEGSNEMISLSFNEMISLSFPSPYCKPYIGTIQESLRFMTVHRLVEQLVLVKQPLSLNHPLRYAFQEWEASQLGLASDDMFAPAYLCNASGAGDCQPPDSLEDLWSSDTTDGDMTESISARVLLGILIERYGEGVVARLVPNLSQASSMDDWLYRSLGIHNADIEEEWLNRVKAVLSNTP